MSGIKDKPVEITLNGIEYKLVFNLNVLETVTEKYDTIKAFTKALWGNEKESVRAIKTGLKALLDEAVDIHNESANEKERLPHLTATQIGRLLAAYDRPIIMAFILEALNKSLPSPEKGESKN